MVNSKVKFNAGKVLYDEESKTCTPLPHKGTVTIKPNAEDDEFYDFIWAPKNNSGNVEPDELLVIPGDVSFKKMQSCSTGRVVALTFLSSGAKNMYWLQDVGDDEELNKLTEKDQKILENVNELLAPNSNDEAEKQEEIGNA